MLEIAGGICHEMNQPLQALLGNIELLELQTPPESPVQKKLTAIKAQVLSISDITKKLLHLTSYKTKDYIRQQIIDIDKSSES
jgi:signal transduction histidine kinase